MVVGVGVGWGEVGGGAAAAEAAVVMAAVGRWRVQVAAFKSTRKVHSGTDCQRRWEAAPRCQLACALTFPSAAPDLACALVSRAAPFSSLLVVVGEVSGMDSDNNERTYRKSSLDSDSRLWVVVRCWLLW